MKRFLHATPPNGRCKSLGNLLGNLLRNLLGGPWTAPLGALCLLASQAGCGASLYAVYEGDVRFEHCMALDSQSDLRPSIRRGCWDEWLSFYTFGQTRDRVAHAQVRARQLRGLSDFVAPPPETPNEPPPKKPSAAPPDDGAATYEPDR